LPRIGATSTKGPPSWFFSFNHDFCMEGAEQDEVPDVTQTYDQNPGFRVCRRSGNKTVETDSAALRQGTSLTVIMSMSKLSFLSISFRMDLTLGLKPSPLQIRCPIQSEAPRGVCPFPASLAAIV
jgi:hypothetical protein